MKIYQDKQVRNFGFFLLFFMLIFCLTGMGFYISQTESAKRMFLSHDKMIVTSLLEQGISEDVIAEVITNTENSKEAEDFLIKIGITEKTSVSFFSVISQFRQKTGLFILTAFFFLTSLIFIGTFCFLWNREKLYQRSANIITNYIDGDYSCRLPQTSEGTIYQMFASVDELASILRSKNETERRTKDFLKNTISDISHQLKTPLAALEMYREIMAGEPDNSDTVKEFSAKMELALQRMERLIQSMLKISQLDAGNVAFEKRRFQISELMVCSLNELVTRAKMEKKEILLDGPSDETLMCDMDWTSEAIKNIVKNALDHTDSGDNVRISWEKFPTMTRISITDNGNGIAPEDIHHIFKRFYRSKNSLDNQGVGLGLPLAKAIVEGQGGVISVKSNLKEGTTFTLSFLTEM